MIIPVSDAYKLTGNDNIRGHTVFIAAGDQSSACIIDVVGGNKANSNRLLYTWGNNIYGTSLIIVQYLSIYKAGWDMEMKKTDLYPLSYKNLLIPTVFNQLLLVDFIWQQLLSLQLNRLKDLLKMMTKMMSMGSHF